MSINLELVATDYRKFTHGNIELTLPVYRDILGREFDAIEAAESLEMEWNISMVTLTEKLAAARGLNLMEVTKLIGEAENSTTQIQVELLGEFMPEFVKLANARPSQRAKDANLVLAMLHRVDRGVTLEQVFNLPRRLFNEILGFAVEEQQGGEAPQYRELLITSQNAQDEMRKLLKLVEEVYITLKDSDPAPKRLDRAKKSIEGYYTELAEGK